VRRSLRKLRTALILLAVLAVVLGVVDRVAVRVAQDQIAQRLLDMAGFSGGSVEVSIHGFPFLTQVARGRYADIEVQARGVALQDIQDLDISAHLRGVRLSASDLRSGGNLDVPADSAQGYVTIPYTEVARRAVEAGSDLGLSALSLRRSGRDVAIAAKVTVLGVEVRPSAQAQVSVDGGAPHLILGDVHLDGFGVPSAAVDAAVLVITTVLDRALELPTLPYGLQLTSVIAASSGIRINAAAADVIL
jgi:hypothetical protein